MGSSCSKSNFGPLLPHKEYDNKYIFVNSEGVHVCNSNSFESYIGKNKNIEDEDGVAISCNMVYKWFQGKKEKKIMFTDKTIEYSCDGSREWSYKTIAMENIKYFPTNGEQIQMQIIQLENEHTVKLESKYQLIKKLEENWQKMITVYRNDEKLESKTFYNRYQKIFFEIKYSYMDSYLLEEYYYPTSNKKIKVFSYEDPLVCYSDEDGNNYFYNKKFETIVNNTKEYHFYNNLAIVRVTKYDKNDIILQEAFFGVPRFAFECKPKDSVMRVRYEYVKKEIDFIDNIKVCEAYFDKNNNIIRKNIFGSNGMKKEMFYYNKLIQCYGERIDNFITYQYFRSKTLHYVNNILIREEFFDIEDKLIKNVKYLNNVIRSIEYKKNDLNNIQEPSAPLLYLNIAEPSAPPFPIASHLGTVPILKCSSMSLNQILVNPTRKTILPENMSLKVLTTDNNECSICCVCENIPQPKCKMCKFSYMCKECEDRCVKSGKCPFCNGLYE